jgi:hypothetical protein
MPIATLLMAFVCIWLSSIVAEAWPPRPGQVGCASWYGADHHGKPTATGERFPIHRLTARSSHLTAWHHGGRNIPPDAATGSSPD